MEKSAKQQVNMEKKKPTKGDIERKIRNAIVFVPKDKDTESIYFSDKGLRLTATMDYVVIATGFHCHVFSSVTTGGFSRPYMYTKRLIEIALGNDCVVKDDKGNSGYSYAKLFEVLKAKEDKTEYNVAMYTDWWLAIIFAPLYAIDENAASQFNVYHKYLSHIATQNIFLSEHKEGLTNKEFVEKHNELMKDLLKGLQENPIFEPLSDEDMAKKEMEALREQEVERQIEESGNGN